MLLTHKHTLVSGMIPLDKLDSLMTHSACFHVMFMQAEQQFQFIFTRSLIQLDHAVDTHADDVYEKEGKKKKIQCLIIILSRSFKLHGLNSSLVIKEHCVVTVPHVAFPLHCGRSLYIKSNLCCSLLTRSD